MRNTILKAGLFSFFVLIQIACTKKTEDTATNTGVDKEKIKSEIQAIENVFAEHYNSRNMDSITYYADDAKSFFIGREPISGKDAIIEYLSKDIKGSASDIQFSFTTNEVFVSNDAQLVTELGEFQLLDSTNTKIDGGNYISVFEKRNGKYVCVRDMAASTMPQINK